VTSRKVLNSGFVRLTNVMGDDLSVVRSARVSVNEETKGPEKDKKLIKFLMQNKHETPFEHVVFTFHIKCPIFIARQWMRHRLGSFNEISGRYVKLDPEFYIPAYFRKQVGKNYEYENMDEVTCNELQGKLQNFYYQTYNFYKKLLDKGVAKEQARSILPLGMYTQFYWTVNARWLMNFLKLRFDIHAQSEMRDYARVLLDIMTEKLPWTTQYFIELELSKK
jgi:thymidylate synthase (FAD)